MAVWVLVVLVAASRVWLGVHWTSDVVASLLLAVLGIAAAERFIRAAHAGSGCAEARARLEQRQAVRVQLPVNVPHGPDSDPKAVSLSDEAIARSAASADDAARADGDARRPPRRRR